jgi:DNA-binding XRE family transcriptional regulator
MRSPLSTGERIPARFFLSVAAGEKHFEEASRCGLGAAIVHFRERAGLTTAEAARRADLSPQALHAIERGEAEPHWGTARRLAPAVGVNLRQLAEAAERLERGETLAA